METTGPIADPRLGTALVGALVVGLGCLVSGKRGSRQDPWQREEPSMDVSATPVTDRHHMLPVPSERNGTTVWLILRDVQIFPASVIRWVVRHWSKVCAFDAMFGDPRPDQLHAIFASQVQRRYFCTDDVSIQKKALWMGQEACAVLIACLSGRLINSPGAARSDQ